MILARRLIAGKTFWKTLLNAGRLWKHFCWRHLLIDEAGGKERTGGTSKAAGEMKRIDRLFRVVVKHAPSTLRHDRYGQTYLVLGTAVGMR